MRMLGSPHRVEAALLHRERQLGRGDRVISEKDRGAEFHGSLLNRAEQPKLGCATRPSNLGDLTGRRLLWHRDRRYGRFRFRNEYSAIDQDGHVGMKRSAAALRPMMLARNRELQTPRWGKWIRNLSSAPDRQRFRGFGRVAVDRPSGRRYYPERASASASE